MLERFAEKSVKVFIRAQQHALELGKTYCGTSDILAALFWVESEAKRALAQGTDFERCEKELAREYSGRQALAKADRAKGSHGSMQAEEPEMLFSPKVKSLLVVAWQTARLLNQPKVMPGHLLLGILEQPDCTAHKLLNNLNVDLRALRRNLYFEFENGPQPGGGEPERADKRATAREPDACAVEKSFTDRARHVLQLALLQSEQLSTSTIGPELLLLALLRDDSLTVTRFLARSGITESRAWRSVVRRLSTGKKRRAQTGAVPSYSTSMIRVLDAADQAAFRYGAAQVGTLHLLLALLNCTENSVTEIFTSLSVDRAALLRKLEDYLATPSLHALISTGPYAHSESTLADSAQFDILRAGEELAVSAVLENFPLAPTTRAVLELAARQAECFKHARVGTEHIALGLLLEGDCPAAQSLVLAGLSLPAVQFEVKQMHAMPRGKDSVNNSARSAGRSYAKDSAVISATGTARENTKAAATSGAKGGAKNSQGDCSDYAKVTTKEGRPEQQEAEAAGVFSVRAVEACGAAMDIAKFDGQHFVLPEHLLLSMLRQQASGFRQVLARQDADPLVVRTLVDKFMLSAAALPAAVESAPVLYLPGDIEKFSELSESARQLLLASASQARSYGYDKILLESLIQAFAQIKEGIVYRSLASFGLDLPHAKKDLQSLLTSSGTSGPAQIRVCPYICRLLEESAKEAKKLDCALVEPEHILLALFSDSGSFPEILLRLSIAPAALRRRLIQEIRGHSQSAPGLNWPADLGGMGLSSPAKIRTLRELAPARGFKLALPSGKIESMSPGAEQIFSSSSLVARLRGRSCVDSEDLLISLLRCGDELTSEFFAAGGVGEDRVMEIVDSLVSPAPPLVDSIVTATNLVDEIRSLAKEIAWQAAASQVGEDHILLALLLAGRGVAAFVLKEYGLNEDGIREFYDKALRRYRRPGEAFGTVGIAAVARGDVGFQEAAGGAQGAAGAAQGAVGGDQGATGAAQEAAGAAQGAVGGDQGAAGGDQGAAFGDSGADARALSNVVQLQHLLVEGRILTKSAQAAIDRARVEAIKANQSSVLNAHLWLGLIAQDKRIREKVKLSTGLDLKEWRKLLGLFKPGALIASEQRDLSTIEYSEEAKQTLLTALNYARSKDAASGLPMISCENILLAIMEQPSSMSSLFGTREADRLSLRKVFGFN